MNQILHVLRTCNPVPDRRLGPLARWLVATRACVFSMSVLSAGIGGMFAALAGSFDTLSFGLVLLGVLFAHAANNLVNDAFDVRHGVDQGDYPRLQYAPHPVLSGLMSTRSLWLSVLLLDVLDLAVALWFVWKRGWPVMLFASAGLALSVFYVAPPFKLKHRGLGEAAIFAIWGPLLIGGTFYALTGRMESWVWWGSVPYGLAVTAVVMGKHLDKRDKDAARRVGTLPVLLGHRGGTLMMGGLVWATYIAVSLLAFFRALPWSTLLVWVSALRAVRLAEILAAPMPTTPARALALAGDAVPADLRAGFDASGGRDVFPLWPLWYVVWGVWWVRTCGGWLVVGLALAIVERWLGVGPDASWVPWVA